MTAAVAGVILAGGRSMRMGGSDKSLAALGGKPAISRVATRLKPQVTALAINANGDPSRFFPLGLDVLGDALPGWQGPLAGVLAALHWADGKAARVLTVPADTPFIPQDLAQRMIDAAPDGLVLASSGGRVHPVVALWPVALRPDLAEFLASVETRKVSAFTDRHRPVITEFAMIDLSDGSRLDPFFNINTPDDLAFAEAALKRLPA